MLDTQFAAGFRPAVAFAQGFVPGSLDEYSLQAGHWPRTIARTLWLKRPVPYAGSPPAIVPWRRSNTRRASRETSDGIQRPFHGAVPHRASSRPSSKRGLVFRVLIPRAPANNAYDDARARHSAGRTRRHAATPRSRIHIELSALRLVCLSD